MKWQDFTESIVHVIQGLAGVLGCLLVCGRTDLNIDLHVAGTDARRELKSPVALYKESL